MTSRPSTDAPILAVLAIVLAVYLGGYLSLGLCLLLPNHRGAEPPFVRIYPYGWQAAMFWPAAKVESLVRGASVSVEGGLGQDDAIILNP